MIMVSGGGTGGHIFPAIAIVQELESMRQDFQFLFVGAKGKMEMEKVPKAGYSIIGLPVSAFHRRITLKNLLFPFKLIVSLIKANRIVKKNKPSLVIGTGGFASGPLMKAAARNKVPILIQEQNAFPGVTNRLMAAKAEKICVAHDGLESWFPAHKIKLTGNPVRKDLAEIGSKKQEGLKLYNLTSDKPVVLLFGGSLGALALNDAVIKNIDVLRKMDIQLIWQTGKSYLDTAKSKIADSGSLNIQAYAFLEKMDLAYASCDIVISRAGAITLSELALAAKPCVLVPYPAAAGNHQMKNALAYSDKKAARVIDNKDVSRDIVGVLKELLLNEKLRLEMSKNLEEIARPEAGKDIAEEVIRIVQNQSN